MEKNIKSFFTKNIFFVFVLLFSTTHIFSAGSAAAAAADDVLKADVKIIEVESLTQVADTIERKYKKALQAVCFLDIDDTLIKAGFVISGVDLEENINRMVSDSEFVEGKITQRAVKMIQEYCQTMVLTARPTISIDMTRRQFEKLGLVDFRNTISGDHLLDEYHSTDHGIYTSGGNKGLALEQWLLYHHHHRLELPRAIYIADDNFEQIFAINNVVMRNPTLFNMPVRVFYVTAVLNHRVHLERMLQYEMTRRQALRDAREASDREQLAREGDGSGAGAADESPSISSRRKGKRPARELPYSEQEDQDLGDSMGDDSQKKVKPAPVVEPVRPVPSILRRSTKGHQPVLPPAHLQEVAKPEEK